MCDRCLALCARVVVAAHAPLAEAWAFFHVAKEVHQFCAQLVELVLLEGLVASSQQIFDEFVVGNVFEICGSAHNPSMNNEGSAHCAMKGSGLALGASSLYSPMDPSAQGHLGPCRAPCAIVLLSWPLESPETHGLPCRLQLATTPANSCMAASEMCW